MTYKQHFTRLTLFLKGFAHWGFKMLRSSSVLTPLLLLLNLRWVLFASMTSNLEYHGN